MKKVKHAPLYMVVVGEIRKFIIDNGIGHGQKLPTENELCKRLGISRGTLREGMRVLEEEGLVRRRQGVGTFIHQNDHLIYSTLEANEGVSEMIRGKNMVPGSLSTKYVEIAADKELAARLDIPLNDPVVVIKRVRTADGTPVAYTEDYMPAGLLLPDYKEYLEKGSLYTYIEDHLGYELMGNILRLEPRKASEAIANAVGIKPGDLLMFLQQTDTDTDNRPIVYSEEYFVSSRFEFFVMRRRKR